MPQDKPKQLSTTEQIRNDNAVITIRFFL